MNVLLLEDDDSIAIVITAALKAEGLAVTRVATIAERDRVLADQRFVAFVSDVMLPDGDGIATLDAVRIQHPEMPVIILSAQNTLDTAVRASGTGAFEYFPKPFDIDELARTVRQAAGKQAITDDEADDVSAGQALPLVGRSPPMQAVYRMITRVLRNDLTVLVLGESGTGKELVAEAIHQLGHRASGPFIAVNTAAIPAELIESELFGHEKGAFTGAVARHIGKFEQAESGTLFLDEIGDMPLEAQTRLLRVLQQGEYTTVGGRTPIKTNVRIIAATHRDLKNQIQQGLFREDLFYRLNVVPLRLPPLRERLEDVGDLIRHFLRQAGREGMGQKSIETSAIDRFKAHPWPGNVRELENVVRRLVALYPQDTLTAQIVEQELVGSLPMMAAGSDGDGSDLGESVERYLTRYFSSFGSDLPPPGLYDRVIREVEKPLLSAALAATRGNQIRAAELLGLNRNTLRSRIRDLNIRVLRTVEV